MPDQRSHTGRERRVITKGQIDTGNVCPVGSDYCYICGHIAPAGDFLKNNTCPNPDCPDPGEWDD